MAIHAWRRVEGIALLVIGAGTLGNGLWMLASPFSWFHVLPADVPDYGPFNPHFVRDIGCAYVVAGLAVLWAWRDAALGSASLGALASATAFHIAHALLHVFDTLRGAVASKHWLEDLPGVYVPAAILTLSVGSRLRARGGFATVPISRLLAIAAFNVAAELAAMGVSSHDVTMICKDNSDTLSRDDCCRPNSAGTIIAREMARLALDSEELDVVPDATDRETIGSTVAGGCIGPAPPP
ncbi:MAG: hypothetical protein U0167_00255 [bacterium]